MSGSEPEKSDTVAVYNSPSTIRELVICEEISKIENICSFATIIGKQWHERDPLTSQLRQDFIYLFPFLSHVQPTILFPEIIHMFLPASM